MIRFLIRLVIYFIAAFVGIVAADLILGDNFNVSGVVGYIWVAAIFAIVQAILSPLIGQVVSRNAAAFSGGVGIVSTLIALVVTNIASSSLTVSGGVVTWILAALIVWIFGAIAAFILPFILVKRTVEERRA
jgi:MFS family permease